jgi:negative regulator of flagellin synthesis FlgM
MKINISSSKQPATDRLSVGQNKRAMTDAYQASNTPSSSQVDLSTTARQLQNLQSSEHDLNIEKIQSIKDAIASGKLEIDTSRIADSLITSARELLK